MEESWIDGEEQDGWRRAGWMMLDGIDGGEQDR